MIINYRSVELPLQSKWIWVNGRRTDAQDFGKMLFDAYFDKAAEAKLKSLKLWLYDSQFRIVKTEVMLSRDLFLADVFVCREDGRLGNIHFFAMVTTKETEEGRQARLAKELMKVVQNTGASIKSYDGKNPLSNGGAIVTPKGDFMFGTATNESLFKKDFIFVDIFTDKISERLRSMKAIKIPPINYKPKDLVTRYDDAKKMQVAKAHINKVGDAERKEAQDKAERIRKSKEYQDWWNSLSPEEQRKRRDQSIADWEAKNRPYRND